MIHDQIDLKAMEMRRRELYRSLPPVPSEPGREIFGKRRRGRTIRRNIGWRRRMGKRLICWGEILAGDSAPLKA